MWMLPSAWEADADGSRGSSEDYLRRCIVPYVRHERGNVVMSMRLLVTSGPEGDSNFAIKVSENMGLPRVLPFELLVGSYLHYECRSRSPLRLCKFRSDA